MTLASCDTEYLGVPGYAQDIGQLTQFIDDPRTFLQAKRLLGIRQQAADLAGRHSHLVHGVIGVGPHGPIPQQQLLDLLGHRAVYWIRRRLRAVGQLTGRGRTEHPRQFGAVAGRCGTGIEQPVG